MRVSMFGPKTRGIWVSGHLSQAAAELLADKQVELEVLYRDVHGEKPKAVSAVSVIEYMLRGRVATRRIFEGLRKR